MTTTPKQRNLVIQAGCINQITWNADDMDRHSLSAEVKLATICAQSELIMLWKRDDSKLGMSARSPAKELSACSATSAALAAESRRSGLSMLSPSLEEPRSVNALQPRMAEQLVVRVNASLTRPLSERTYSKVRCLLPWTVTLP